MLFIKSKIYIKTLKTLLHVSITRSSGRIGFVFVLCFFMLMLSFRLTV